VTREWISLFFSVTFLVLMVAGIFMAGRTSRVSLRRLTIAARIYALATAAEAGHLVCKLLDVPSNGWLWVALSLFNLVCAVVALIFTRQRRDLRAEQFGARILREWPGADR
jgi:hypothetical protein